VQKSPTTITVNTISESVALYCISSWHEQCSYAWRRIGDEVDLAPYPSTPVIYIKEGGLYQCTATSKYSAKRTLGKIISLIVDAGQF